MKIYKHRSLITTQQAKTADAPPTEPSKAVPGHDVPLAPETSEPFVDAAQPRATTPGARPTDLWGNGSWAVTEAGLESRYVINGMPIDYLIEKERLTAVLPGTRISMWAAQLAEKSWLDDPKALIEAITEALRRHCPGQTVIDLDATREHAVREWHRTHDRQHDHALGREYEPGEATLRRLERRDAETGPALGTNHGDRIRDALMRHGVDPSVHSGGRHVNEQLTLMAMHGATDEELAAAADRLKDEHILRDEEPEKEFPPEAEDYIDD